MITSLHIYKHNRPNDELIFESPHLQWEKFDKGSTRKSGSIQPHNHLGAILIQNDGEDNALSDNIALLLAEFEKIGGVAVYLKKANAEESWIRVVTCLHPME
jgi:hypothetical protein